MHFKLHSLSAGVQEPESRNCFLFFVFFLKVCTEKFGISFLQHSVTTFTKPAQQQREADNQRLFLSHGEEERLQPPEKLTTTIGNQGCLSRSSWLPPWAYLKTQEVQLCWWNLKSYCSGFGCRSKVGNKGQPESAICQLLHQTSRSKGRHIKCLDVNSVTKSFESPCNNSKWDKLLLSAKAFLVKIQNPNLISNQDLYHYPKYGYKEKHATDGQHPHQPRRDASWTGVMQREMVIGWLWSRFNKFSQLERHHHSV